MDIIKYYLYQMVRFTNLFLLGIPLFVLCMIILFLSIVAIGLQKLIALI
jgi:hypothetical protein